MIQTKHMLHPDCPSTNYFKQADGMFLQSNQLDSSKYPKPISEDSVHASCSSLQQIINNTRHRGEAGTQQSQASEMCSEIVKEINFLVILIANGVL